jgi:arginine/lysine/ornithine decarboxylase
VPICVSTYGNPVVIQVFGSSPHDTNHAARRSTVRRRNRTTTTASAPRIRAGLAQLHTLGIAAVRGASNRVASALMMAASTAPIPTSLIAYVAKGNAAIATVAMTQYVAMAPVAPIASGTLAANRRMKG